MTFLTRLIQSVHYLIQLLFNGYNLYLIYRVKQIVGNLDLHPMVEVTVMLSKLDCQNYKLSSHEANTMLLLSMV